MAGIFFTFEGIEGCGKSTQAAIVAEHLRRAGHGVVATREPGGTRIGDQVRTILLSTENEALVPEAEFFLYCASRIQHVREKIRPAIEAGQIVICDRYADATRAYQGSGRGIEPQRLEGVLRIAMDGLSPDRTYLLDLDPRVGLTRARQRDTDSAAAGRSDRFERESMEFHTRVREEYLRLSRAEPERFAVIDASGTPEAVSSTIVADVEQYVERCHGR